jgi:four helix bundle protein
MDIDLNDRLFKFAIDVITFLRTIKNNQETGIIKYQLTKASTSSGANYEESQAASSKADFANKVNISLKEMRESNYWLRVIKATEINKSEKCIQLINESAELKKILATICKNSRGK